MRNGLTQSQLYCPSTAFVTMETEAGYLALNELGHLKINEKVSKITLTQDPTDIIWENLENGKIKLLRSFTLFASIIAVISITILLNYSFTAWTEVLGRKYESRCFGEVVSETHFIREDISVGCFCEAHYLTFGSSLSSHKWLNEKEE